MQFKDNLLKLLKEKKITLIALEKKSKVPKSTLHAWTTGQTAVNLIQLQAVANALEVELYALLYGAPDPHQSITLDLEEIFSGDVRVSVKRLKKTKP